MPKLSELLNEAVPVKFTHREREYHLEIYPERATRNLTVESAEKELAERGAGDVHTFTTVIKSWDITGDDEQPLPINAETINRLGGGLKVAIAEAIMREALNPSNAASVSS